MEKKKTINNTLKNKRQVKKHIILKSICSSSFRSKSKNDFESKSKLYL